MEGPELDLDLLPVLQEWQQEGAHPGDGQDADGEGALKTAAMDLEKAEGKHFYLWHSQQDHGSLRLRKRGMAAAAEAATQEQAHLLERIAEYVRQMSVGHRFTPLALFVQESYDATNLTLRVVHEASLPEKEVSKTMVVEKQWAILLKEQGEGKEHLCLRGSLSPIVRATSTGTGESTQAALASAVDIPAELRSLCPVRLRIAESDEAGSNTRAEALIAHHSPEPWFRQHMYCLAHKLHAACLKSWSLVPSFMSGLKHASLQLQGSGGMRRLQDKIKALVTAKLTILDEDVELTQGAVSYREAMMRHFADDQLEHNPAEPQIMGSCLRRGCG